MIVRAMLKAFAVLVLFYNVSTAQNIRMPQIPCPNIFEYAFNGANYFGIITLSDIAFGTTTVEIEMTQPGVLNQEYSGNLNLNIDKDRVFDYIRSGRPVPYRVDFPLQNVIPRVTQINVNGNRICYGPKDPPPRATMNLEHTLRTYATLSAGQQQRNPFDITPASERIPNRQVFNPIGNTNDSNDFVQDYIKRMLITQTTETPNEVLINPFSNDLRDDFRRPNIFGARNPPPVVPTVPTTTTTARPTTATGPTTSSYIDSICGQENTNVNVKKLAVNGEEIDRSRFPWIVAIYTSEASSWSFQCGGSLITARTVISAAHCFQKGLEAIKAENLLMSMGLHNLNEWDNAVNRGVQQLIRHPDYRPEVDNFDADVAIAQLKLTVTFSPAIRPICLWQGPTDIRVIEGANGIVVGWGEDEKHTGVVSIPKLVNATIVSELTCIRSNEKFYYLTSNRTLCAGNRDGSGPCMGDSGSGLMVRNRNKWMLRGTVSASLSSRAQQCNLEEYVVYADIAKFLDWIKSNMLF